MVATTITGQTTAEEAGTEMTGKAVTVVATEIAVVVTTETTTMDQEEVLAAATVEIVVEVVVVAAVAAVGDVAVVEVEVDSIEVWMMSTTAMETEVMTTIQMLSTKPKLSDIRLTGLLKLSGSPTVQSIKNQLDRSTFRGRFGWRHLTLCC